MKRGWLVAVLCCSLLPLGAHAASAAFPNFPTIDDPRVVFGSSFKLVDDDIADDEPAAPLQITHLRVRSEIALRYARTAVVSNVYNPSKRPQEAIFHVLLPETAFISGFTMTLGKETYEAYVKEKEEAKQIYDDAVAQGVSAAHVATKARDSNHFTIKFNLEGRSNATYRLTYEELLVRRNGVYNHAINLLPGALVPKMDVVVHIKESQKISVLRVPELRTGNEIDATENDAQNTKSVIQRGRSGREATITFTPDLAEQRRLAEIYAEKIQKTSDPDSSNIGYDSAEEENDKEGLLGQFVVQYDVDQPKNGEILVNDGYFVHFFSPSCLPPLSKHVVFVLDTSGSMEGTKIEQLRKAMDAILSDLNPTDYFSIIEFNTNIIVHDLNEIQPLPLNHYPPSPVNLVPPAIASPENIASAKRVVSELTAYGATNIYGALDVAINIIQNWTHAETQTDAANVSLVKCDNGTDQNKNVLEPIIIFLTDGQPNVGEVNTDRIITHMSEKNSGVKRAPLYSLAFGDDADRAFLRKLSLRNEGFMRHIYEAADAALQLHHFYRQVSSPLLADVKFLYPRRQIKEGSISRSEFRTINDGSEVAVVGRIAEDINEITPQVRGLRGDGDGRGRKLYELNPKVPVTRGKDEYLPLERLWAYLTIKQLLDKSDANDVSHSGSEDDSSEESPKKKALNIALKYSFVTPLTSLVVVRLNKTDVVEPVDAETVDDPNFLPYRVGSAAPLTSLKTPTYTGISTGERLSVESDTGPILFALSTKRFNTGAHASAYGSFHSNSQSGYGAVSYGSAHSSANGYKSHGSSHGNSNKYNNGVPSRPFPPHSTTTTTPSALAAMYHLEGYEWTLNYINNTEEALMIRDTFGKVVQLLKLSRDVNPPQGDYECWPGEPADSNRAGLRCVYLTRCAAARNFTFYDYLYRYCFVGDRYAGVCCPANEIN
ncbi:inter-alpha-trypsin inhibitor heavy chain H3-like [Maniola jurtina]|uniref:inter-alpha-trypsin inhibitor heavy chain H3-like n=1 Tax=Maniola jurtina TaxID=191418 RepID=UPI001E68D238|nr:inter-alpha-trypsin inhibitor heavy chain H3-like [Maniola jurtina]